MAEGTSIPSGNQGSRRFPLGAPVYARVQDLGVGTAGTRQLVGSISSGTAVRIPTGSFDTGTYLIEALPAANLATVGAAAGAVTENLHIRVGDSTVTATSNDMPHRFVEGPLVINLLPGQTNISLIRANGGTLTLSIYAQKLA